VNSETVGLLKVALDVLVVGMTTVAEAVEMMEISVGVKDSAGVSAGISEDVVNDSVSVSVSVSVPTGVSAGRSEDSVAVGSWTAVDWRIRVDTPYLKAQSVGSMSSGQQNVFPAGSKVQ
jgi:hypothetical protein